MIRDLPAAPTARGRWRAGALALLAILAFWGTVRADTPVTSDSLRPQGTRVDAANAASVLRIETGRGPAVFSVELALTPQQQARGLQKRRTLPADAGMLFDFGAPRRVSMWMKDTYIPLDMLFIGADGRIAAIARDTEPLSLETISPAAPARAVLELNAGTAARLGIDVGDRIDHPIFDGKRR